MDKTTEALTSFVFDGEVVSVGSSTIPGIPPGIPTIDVTLKGKPFKPTTVLLADGDRVALKVGSTSSYAVGDKLRFYADAWIFGDGVAVRELWHEAIDPMVSVDSEGDSVLQAHKTAGIVAIATAAKRGNSVFEGTVLSQEFVPVAHRRGEHDPLWHVANVEVNQTYSRDVKLHQIVRIQYPSSMDVAWSGLPKLDESGRRWLFMVPPTVGPESYPSISVNFSVSEARNAVPGPTIDKVLDVLLPILEPAPESKGP